MILLLLATAAAEPLTITTETGDLQANEVFILQPWSGAGRGPGAQPCD